MKTPIQIVCRLGMILALCLLPARGWGEESGKWQPREIAGEEYISVEQIQTFYRFEKLTRNESAVTLEGGRVKAVFEIGSRECVINTIKLVFSRPVLELENKAYISRADLSGFLDPILRPKLIAGSDFKTVILDPARGGADPGVTNAYGTEAKWTLKLAELTKTALEAKGLDVVLTRDHDQELTFQQRVDAANTVKGGAIFITLSFGSGQQAERGIRTSAVSRSGKSVAADSFGNASVALATAVHGAMIRKLGKNTSDLGIRQSESDLDLEIAHPTIFVEGGQMTHPYEARLIANDQYLSAIAGGVAEGVEKYRRTITAPDTGTAEEKR